MLVLFTHLQAYSGTGTWHEVVLPGANRECCSAFCLVRMNIFAGALASLRGDSGKSSEEFIKKGVPSLSPPIGAKDFGCFEVVLKSEGPLF